MRIAIVGIGCRYPGAKSPKELWENLLAGRRYFRSMPAERWRTEDYYDSDRTQPDKTYSRSAALIDGFEFNAAAFRITQRTYASTDQAQWLALQTASEALQDAGLKEVPRDTTAVVLGNSLTGETSRTQILRFRWPYTRRVFDEVLAELQLDQGERERLLPEIERRYKEPLPDITEDTLAGGLSNTIAGRVCNFFDFHGGGYTVDGACSSSLLAVIDAAKGLACGDWDLALAGGVDISLDPFELVGFAKVGALSDGEMRVYDERSRGFLPGEGCGVVVLKRLDDALRDGDHVYATLAGWGVSSDGKGGLTAPRVEGQVLAISRAYARAGYTLDSVGLLEGHGTGTVVGDEVELLAVTESMRRQGVPDTHACAIGSIKSNLGHTKAAAGVAGLIKAALAVHYRLMPPTLGIRRPHRVFATNPSLFPAVRGREWPADVVARAGVSSAGFGGINTHVTLEEPPVTPVNPYERARLARLFASAQDAELLLFSGRHAGDLLERVGPYADAARRISLAELSDLSAASVKGLDAGAARLAVVASSPDELAQRLDKARSVLDNGRASRELVYCDPGEGIYLRTRRAAVRTVFLFPGQGSQRHNATRLWRARVPQVRATWERADAALEGELPVPLSRYVFRDTDSAPEALRQRWTEDLTETAVAQPAILASSMAWTELLRYLGLEADLVLGHSLGEYAALWYARAIETRDALRLVAFRGRQMSGSGDERGTMLGVAESPEVVRELLRDAPGYVDIANYNGPRATVISGERAAVGAVRAACRERGIHAAPLQVSNAFHSRLMEGAAAALHEALGAVVFQPPRRQVVSSCTGGFLTGNEDLADLLARQVTSPVLFQQALEACLEAGAELFVEVGPGSVLTRLARQIVGERGGIFLASDPDPEVESVSGVLNALAYGFVSGADVRPLGLFDERLVRPIQLPYAPRFIASPCEQPVEPIRLTSRVPVLEVAHAGSAGLAAAALRPNGSGQGRISGNGHGNGHANGNGRDPGAFNEPGNGRPAEVGGEAGILALLRQYIVDTFGYPPEMVSPSARMSDDLGLDSIKAAEVVAVAMGRLGVKQDPAGLMALELSALAGRLAELHGGGAPAPAPSGAGAPAAAQGPMPARWVRTFATRLVPAERGAERGLPASGPALLAAAEPTPLLGALREALVARGLDVLAVTDLKDVPAGTRPGLCMIVAAEPESELKPASSASAALLWFAQMFEALQFALGAGQQPPPPVTLVLPTRSQGREWGWDVERAAGSGLIKTLALEHPGLETRVVEVDSALPLQGRVAVVLGELGAGTGHVHSVHDAQGRRVPELIPTSPMQLAVQASPLQAGDVVLVTGGAKGITARLAQALAEAKGVRLALVGRGRPADDVEVRNALVALAAQGLDAQYYTCDVTDEADVMRLTATVSEHLGPIAGVVHGAGTNTIHRLVGGNLADFLAILRPKILGLSHLVRHIDPSRLRQFVVLSSVIGDSGMTGNADYAFANEWVNLTLARLRRVRPGTQWLSYAFSVWDEVGMGHRLGSVPALRRMGIEPIPPAAGTRAFLDLFDRDWPDASLVVAAPLGTLPTLRFASGGARQGRFFEALLRDVPGVELEVECGLDPERDGYVREHDYQGSRLLPAVVGMEAMARVAEAALALPGCVPPAPRPAICNARFGRPVVVPPGGRKVRIHALVDEAAASGERRVHVTLRSAVTDFESDHFACDMVWDKETLSEARTAFDWPAPLPVDPQQGLYGTILFQGPMFRNVLAYHSVSPTSCRAAIRVPPRDLTGLAPTLLGAPEVRDAFLHAIQLCVPEFRILPVSIDCIRTKPHESPILFLSAVERLREGRDFLYDVEVRDEGGRLVEVLQGFRCRSVEVFDDAPTLALIQRMHALSATHPTQPQASA